MKSSFRFWFFSGVLAVSAVSSAADYQLDDGTGEFSTASSSHQVLAVGFQTIPGFTTIGNIEFYNYWNVGQGHAINYHLWTDPNNDGQFHDALLQRSVATTISNFGGTGGYWQSVNIAPITLNAGDVFYVGVSFDDPQAQYFLGADDRTAPNHGQSWFVNWGTNPSNPNNIGSGTVNSINTDYLIRANAVPEPTSMAAMLGGAGLMALRRRRKK